MSGLASQPFVAFLLRSFATAMGSALQSTTGAGSEQGGCAFCRIRMHMCAVGVLDCCTKRVMLCVAELEALKGQRYGRAEMGNPGHGCKAWH